MGCPCCGLDNAIFTPRKAFNGLPQASIVCDLCARHQGSDVHDLKKAAKVHREMWEEHERERIELLEECQQRQIAERDARIAGLQEELEQRPVRVVEKWMEAGVLNEAHEAAARAYHSRDHAFRQMCLIHMKHHEVTGERCSCGRSIADCDVVGILEGYRALMRWELRQEERRDQGKSHQLPYEYVKYLGGSEPGDDLSEYDPYEYELGS